MTNRKDVGKQFSERFRFFLGTHHEAEIAKGLKVSMATIYAWRTERKTPGLATFLAVCNFFRVTPDEFLGIQDLKKPRSSDLKKINESWPALSGGAREAILTITNLSMGVTK